MEEIVPQKVCKKCGGTEFYKSGHCKACRSVYRKKYYVEHIEHELALSNKYNAEHHDERSSYMLMWKYGVTIGQYGEMFAEQNGTCAICGSPPNGKQLGVDHNHATGKVRGLLCARCNLALGLWESIGFLTKAIDYLRKEIENEKSTGNN